MESFKKFFRGAPFGIFAGLMVILYLIISIIVGALYFDAMKENDTFLKAFIVSNLLAIVFTVKVYYDFKIKKVIDKEKDVKESEKLEKGKNLLLDTAYLACNLYFIVIVCIYIFIKKEILSVIIAAYIPIIILLIYLVYIAIKIVRDGKKKAKEVNENNIKKRLDNIDLEINKLKEIINKRKNI